MTIMTELTADSMKIKRGGDDLIVTGKEHLVTVFEGWKKTAMRRSTSARIVGNGDISERGTKGSKVISIAGESEFDTELDAEQFVLQLERFLSDGQVGIIEVEEVTLGVTLKMAVELNTFDDPVILGNTVGWSYELYAADPAKYGPVQDFIPQTIYVPEQPIYETLPRNVVRVYNNGTTTATMSFLVGPGPSSPVIRDMETNVDLYTTATNIGFSTAQTLEYRGSNKAVYRYWDGTVDASYGDPYNGVTGPWPTIPPNSSKLFRVTNDNTKYDSGTADVFMDINITGETKKYRATFNNNGNPTYNAQTGVIPASQTNGNTTVTNNGTVTTRAIFVVTGSFPNGLTITETATGKQVIVIGAITATDAEPLVINSMTGKAKLGAVNKSGSVTRREWVDIAPGASATFKIEGTSATNTKLIGRIETQWN